MPATEDGCWKLKGINRANRCVKHRWKVQKRANKMIWTNQAFKNDSKTVKSGAHDAQKNAQKKHINEYISNCHRNANDNTKKKVKIICGIISNARETEEQWKSSFTLARTRVSSLAVRLFVRCKKYGSWELRMFVCYYCIVHKVRGGKLSHGLMCYVYAIWF